MRAAPAPVRAGSVVRVLVAATVALLLAACAAQRVKAPLPELSPAELAAAEEAQARRAELLRAQPDWALTGRMAVSKGRNGGSGRIEWQERAESGYEVVVSAPVSRQSWRLVGGVDGSARLEGVDGGPREGPAEQVLLETVGWEIPVAPLRDWLRALPAAGRAGAAAPELAYGGDGRLRELRQHGWTIEYQDWHPASGGRPELPRRLEARHGDALVRLVVDEWRL